MTDSAGTAAAGRTNVERQMSNVASAIVDRGSSMVYPSHNHRGDVVLVTDANGGIVERNEYSAFGAPLNTSCILNPASCIRCAAFSSKEYDTASGLSYYGFRYYDAHSARWMNREPSGADGPNQYWFVHNSPTRLLDRRGKDSFDSYAEYNSGYLFTEPVSVPGAGVGWGGSPGFMDNFVIVGPSAGSYQRQERYFETRWRGWTEAMKIYWRSRIDEWVYSHCGCTPYNEGLPKFLDLVVQVDPRNSGMYGDKPMTDWETNKGIGKFTYLVDTPVRIAYSSSSDGSKLFGWSAYLYVEDRPGGKLSGAEWRYVQWAVTERSIVSARWKISSIGTCR